jgi:hypothetical protein
MACLGLFRRCAILRRFWYSSSKVAADRPVKLIFSTVAALYRIELPFPTLLVNLVKLSEKPNTVFFTKLAAPFRKVLK